MQGCWTCRVRRKRCEASDSGRCATCARLDLSCDGNGPKPHWMDGGDRERMRRRELKNLIKQNQLRRRGHEGRRISEPYSIDSVHPSVAVSPGNDEFTSSHAVWSLTPSELPWEAPEADNLSFQGSLTDVNLLNHDGRFDTTCACPADIYRIPMLQDCSPCGLDPGGSTSSSSHGNESSVRNLPALRPSSEDPALDHYRPPGFKHWSPSRANLIMIYLDEVFPRQYPLYSYLSLDTKRGWLLNILAMSTTFCSLSLAIASFYSSAGSGVQSETPDQHRDDISCQNHWQDFESQGLGQLQAEIKETEGGESATGPRTIHRRTIVLGCTLQLAFLAVSLASPFRVLPLTSLLQSVTGRKVQAVQHLKASCELLSMIANDSKTSALASADPLCSQQSPIGKDLALGHFACLLLAEAATLAAQTRTTSILHQDLAHWIVQTFESTQSGLLRYVALLNDTACLDGWWTTCKEKKTMSHFNLVKRANDILEHLKEPVLETLPVDSISTGGDCSPAPVKRNTGQHVQLLYQQAISVYLHLIVSGPCDPEIEEHINGAVQTLRTLSSSGINSLLGISLPLAVISSLAQGEVRDVLRSLSVSIIQDSRQLRFLDSSQQLMDVIAHGWSSADTGVQDWMPALSSVGPFSTI